MKQQNIDWSSYNGIYSHLVKSNLELSNQKLYDLLISTAIKNKHNFGNLLTVSRVKRYRNRVKYEAVKANPKKHNKTQQYVIDIQKEVIKKTRQNAFLNKHVRQEMTIDSTRESVVESLKYKLDRSEERKIKVPSLSNLKMEDSEDGYVLQHIMTDIHVNEVTIRKGGKTNWDTNKALKTVSNILNLLIEKQIKEKNKYSSLQLLLLGDLIGTKIHEGIVLDIESNRAAKFLASIIAQAVPTLIHYFGNVEIIIVPGNHSETRLGHEKNDQFNENYDFLVGEYLKEMLSVIDLGHIVNSPNRDVPIVATRIGTEIHGCGHGDRFNTDFKKMMGLFSEYCGINYIDYWHEGHFHNQKIRYQDGFLKLTYPCVTEDSFYAQNRYGVGGSREPQVGNIYSDSGTLISTYNLHAQDFIESNKKRHITFNFDLDHDISEIFISTIKSLTSRV